MQKVSDEIRITRKWLYAAREAGILLGAVTVGMGSALTMEAMVYRAASPLFGPAQFKDAFTFTSTAFSFCDIIAAYLAIRFARWVKAVAAFPKDDDASFDAYAAVAFMCWGNILFILLGLPWTTLWRAS